MRQGVGPAHRLETGVGLRVDPKVVLTSYVLQLTQQELDQAIDNELADNPALERLQEDTEPLTDEAILRAVAPHELRLSSDDFEFRRSILQDDGERADWTELASTTTSLLDHLRAQLLPSLPNELQHIGALMIECINEKGYLSSPVEEIALMANCPMEDVETVLNVLKQCEPCGVGAANVQECLLLQLRDADTVEKKLARAILKGHLDDFLARRTTRIMRRYRVLPEVVHAAFDEILQLTPFPGESFSTGPASAQSLRHRSSAVSPDVKLTLNETGWEIEVSGADPNSLTINRSYRRRLQELKNAARASNDEKQHVSEYVQKASNFIQSLYQRRKTLRRIAEYLVHHQNGFVSTGQYQFLRPLTRTLMAKDLGMHESTISRATTGKFVQIANGEVLSFEVFFKPALRVQKMIEEILERENPQNPLSDEAIAELLKQKGVHVARRTVNKYRDRGKLLSSRKRRSA